MPCARRLQLFSAAVQILMYSYGSGAVGCLFALRGRRSSTCQFRLETLAAKVRQLPTQQKICVFDGMIRYDQVLLYQFF